MMVSASTSRPGILLMSTIIKENVFIDILGLNKHKLKLVWFIMVAIVNTWLTLLNGYS